MKMECSPDLTYLSIAAAANPGMYKMPSNAEQLYTQIAVNNEMYNSIMRPAVTIKQRKTNFTPREVEILLSSVSKRRDAILFGVAGGQVWAQAWQEVAQEVSAVEGIERTVNDVRKKWTYLKWEAKNTSKPGRDPTSRAVLEILTGRDSEGTSGVSARSLLEELLVPQQGSGRSTSPQASTSMSSGFNASNTQTSNQSKKSNVSVTPSSSPPQQALDVCLRWNSYYSNMQAVFPNLLTNEQFVDVTLAADGQSIKCHKVMLSACSSYFQDLLTNNPCPHPIILMKDVRFRELKDLVNFMYRGEVSVQQDRLPSLLAAAEALQIKGLSGIPSEEDSTNHSGPEDTQLPPDPPVHMSKRFGKRKVSGLTQNSLSIKRQNNAASHQRTSAINKTNTCTQQQVSVTHSVMKKRQDGCGSPPQHNSTIPVKSTPTSTSSGFNLNAIKEEPLDTVDSNAGTEADVMTDVMDQSVRSTDERYSRGASKSNTTLKNESEYLENYNEDSGSSDSDDISDLDSPAGLHVMPEVVMDPGESNSY